MKNKGQPPNDELATQCVANLQKSSAEALATGKPHTFLNQRARRHVEVGSPLNEAPLPCPSPPRQRLALRL
jgi:hypothetical protein